MQDCKINLYNPVLHIISFHSNHPKELQNLRRCRYAGLILFQTKFVVRKSNFFFWKGLVNQPAPPIPRTTPQQMTQQLVGGTYTRRDPQCVPEKLMNFPFVLETYLTLPGLKTSHKDGTFSPVLSLLWVSVIDLESPVVESGWKHFDPNADVLPRKSWDTFLFAKLLGWTTGGVLDCRGLVFGWHGKLALMSVSKQGWFRFAKSEDKFIWQMFSMEDSLWSSWAEQIYCKHGILHVILRGPQRWQATWFRQSTFLWRCLLRRRKKGISCLLGWRWVYQIHVLSCDDVAVVEQLGSTWSFLLRLKKQVSPGGLPIDETGNELQLTSSPQSVLLWVARSDHVGCWLNQFLSSISSLTTFF